MKIGILLFEQFDLLDVGGPYEVFLTASRLVVRDGGTPPFEVVTVASSLDPVTAYGGMRVIAQAALDEAGPFDVFIVPGAIKIDDVLADRELMAAVRTVAQDTPVAASVCTGAFLLGEFGLLEGRPWTTHWEDVEELAGRIGSPGQAWVRWVDTGDVVTGGGISSGISMALHLVDRFAGRDLALRTARQIEHEWAPEAPGSA
jgi:transcriptional regulator GlxA family with amidase domain